MGSELIVERVCCKLSDYFPEVLIKDIKILCENLKWDISFDSILYRGCHNFFNIDTDIEIEREKIGDKMCHYEEDLHQWTVNLTGRPSEEFFTKFVDKSFEIKGFYHSDSVHRGHYLASAFRSYLVADRDDSGQNLKINHYFGKGNVNNIFFQSSQANCNSKHIRGQLYYENQIIQFISGNLDERNVTFQIQDYRTGEEFSHGRRLLAIFYEKDEIVSDKCFHVFIPNAKDYGEMK